MVYEKLVSDFINATLLKEKWDHLAHIKVGVWHLVNLGLEEGIHTLRERIKRLNNFHGVENSLKSGYHETITVFYMRMIHHHYGDLMTDMSCEEISEQMIAQIGAKDFMFHYYSKEVIGSEQARVHFTEPDLKPLPA